MLNQDHYSPPSLSHLGATPKALQFLPRVSSLDTPFSRRVAVPFKKTVWLTFRGLGNDPALNPIFDFICEMGLKVEREYPEKNDPNAPCLALDKPYHFPCALRVWCVNRAWVFR